MSNSSNRNEKYAVIMSPADSMPSCDSPTAAKKTTLNDNGFSIEPQQLDSPTLVKDFLDMREDVSERSNMRLEDMISQTFSEIEVVMGDILKESSESSLLTSPPTLKRYSTARSEELGELCLGSLQKELDEAEQSYRLPSFDHCYFQDEAEQSYRLPSFDHCYFQDEAEQEVEIRHKERVRDNLEMLSLELQETNAREAELQLKIKKLQNQLEQQRALKERIYHHSCHSFSQESPNEDKIGGKKEHSTNPVPEEAAANPSLKDAFLTFFSAMNRHKDKTDDAEELSTKMELVEQMDRRLATEAASRKRRQQRSIWSFPPSQGILPC